MEGAVGVPLSHPRPDQTSHTTQLGLLVDYRNDAPSILPEANNPITKVFGDWSSIKDSSVAPAFSFSFAINNLASSALT